MHQGGDVIPNQLGRSRVTLARALILGHTHQPRMFDRTVGTIPADVGDVMPFTPENRLLLNPCSVGQSRQRERLS
jgi:hypothetical protein